MINAISGMVDQTSKPKGKKYWTLGFRLLGFLVVATGLVTYRMGYTSREMVLVAICLTALAGMYLTATFAMIIAIIALFKRVKGTDRRRLGRSDLVAKLPDLSADFARR